MVYQSNTLDINMLLDIFALIVIVLLAGMVIWLVVLLGNMPGEIARKRNHSQQFTYKTTLSDCSGGLSMSF